MASINWTEIIVTLGTALISGFFAWLSARRANEAKQQAESSRVHADRAVQASLRPKLELEDDNRCLHCRHGKHYHIPHCVYLRTSLRCDCEGFV